MPVHPVKGGGYQWGNHGKVYHGPQAKAKASAQGRAAHANGYREHGSGGKHHTHPSKMHKVGR
jgi:hypothetical protein